MHQSRLVVSIMMPTDMYFFTQQRQAGALAPRRPENVEAVNRTAALSDAAAGHVDAAVGQGDGPGPVARQLHGRQFLPAVGAHVVRLRVGEDPVGPVGRVALAAKSVDDIPDGGGGDPATGRGHPAGPGDPAIVVDLAVDVEVEGEDGVAHVVVPPAAAAEHVQRPVDRKSVV